MTVASSSNIQEDGIGIGFILQKYNVEHMQEDKNRKLK